MDYQYYDETDYIDIAEEEEDDDDHGGAGYHMHAHAHPADFYDQEHETEDFTLAERLWDSYQNCMLPSLLQIFSYIAPLLLCCLMQRLLSALYLRRHRSLMPLHTLSLLCGLLMLYLTLGQKMLVLVLLSAMSYVLLQLVRLVQAQRAAIIIAVITIGSQFVYELCIWRNPKHWPQLRGMQMIANMKVISLAFDLANKTQMATQSMPNLLAYFGYIYSPASCVLGPWISYTRYLECLGGNQTRKPSWLRSLYQALNNVLLCLLALTISNCIAPAIGEFNSSEALKATSLQRWLLMYMGALSVRTSHYFVSLLSQALLAAMGQQLDAAGSSSALLGELVTRPWHIEWPHSLSALVRSWNVPMHEWLRLYVYAPSKRCMRDYTIVAVFCTYLISSLLHGMDMRIYLVLLSLATFANGEVMLRRHLASISNACISPNPCRGAASCCYMHCPRKRGWLCCSSWLVALTNLAFTLLAMSHLAYLGVVLLNETIATDPNASELPILWHWSSAGYASHYIGLGTFVLYLFIS